MSSINEQQEEKNHEDLRGSEAVKKMKSLVKKAATCFFCTALGQSHRFETRPMSVQETDEQGNLWFLSASDSSQNAQIMQNNRVELLFQGSPHSDFLVLEGTCEISRDKAKIKELWEPLVKTWFTEGVDDPRITVLKVTPTDGYYWDNKHGNAIAFAKMTIGAMIGKTLDDSIEGQIKP